VFIVGLVQRRNIEPRQAFAAFVQSSKSVRCAL
jgi:hypothetical protein